MPANDLFLIGILLLVALLVGWWTGRRGRSSSHRRKTGGSIPADYFKGLNFLLNEQPDKALEVFIHMVEVDSETIETHFALGSLFRRRGEVDRAIRIHQNLIARPNLSRTHRTQALFELGEDYLRAGLLDRAESLFSELSRERAHEQASLDSLLVIYEQQKDWDQAIEVARRLEAVSGRSCGQEIAQYFCELAEPRLQEGDHRAVSKLLRRALSYDRDCVRAMLLNAQLSERNDDARSAVRHYRNALVRDPRRANEILPSLAQLVARGGSRESLANQLEAVLRENPRAAGYLTIALLRNGGMRDAELEEFVARNAGREELLDQLRSVSDRIATLCRGGGDVGVAAIARELFHNAQGDAEHYSCSNCGYSGRRLYWQCPSCRRWDTLEPRHGIILNGE
ncbi:MAG: lipopolysaccharide assembly protein LapB [Gammaproteobacteria bacterium]|nr:lipopolysaccharide assembly protein LapB [Gammaproteobacteria bacterium]